MSSKAFYFLCVVLCFLAIFHSCSAMQRAKYQLTLNYEGVEMLVEVDDLETASTLLNDPVAAQQYVQHVIRQQQLAQAPREQDQPEQDFAELAVAVEEQTPGDQVPAEQAVIWSTKRTTKSDQEATLLLLELRKKCSNQFADKTTRKAKLWADIAKAIIIKGYNLGETPAEKCRQKFTNLQKAYTKYINNQKTTGSEKMELPPFFEEMNEILGEQHKVNPVSLMDTEEDIPSTSENDPYRNPQPSTSSSTPTGKQTLPLNSESNIENRFARQKTFKKFSKTNDFIKEIQEDREARREQFEFFEKHLKKTEQQRDKMISILEKSLKGTNKRKRSPSSNSD